MNDTPKQKRGLALLSPERRKEIASQGGKSVPKSKRAFSRNENLASLAGRKSKRVSHKPVENRKTATKPFSPAAPANADDLLFIHLKVSKADFVVVQEKSRFDLERALQEAWFAMAVCSTRIPVRWTVEVRDASGAVLMTLRNRK